MESIRVLQGYGYFFFVVFLVVVLYGYIFHLYRAEKTGTRNYEKYANIALNDNIDDTPVEEIETLDKKNEKGSNK